MGNRKRAVVLAIASAGLLAVSSVALASTTGASEPDATPCVVDASVTMVSGSVQACISDLNLDFGHNYTTAGHYSDSPEP